MAWRLIGYEIDAPLKYIEWQLGVYPNELRVYILSPRGKDDPMPEIGFFASDERTIRRTKFYQTVEELEEGLAEFEVRPPVEVGQYLNQFMQHSS